MTETLRDTIPKTDPSLTTGNDTARPELREAVGHAIEYFNHQFGLGLNETGNFQTEPTAEQLAQLRGWHERTSSDRSIMSDMDTFTAKVVLARALMPQRDETGNITYLFGKGAGAELALQGEVVGRTKRTPEVPYRPHSDFEIYGVATTSYDALAYGNRFMAVIGAQELYPTSDTKALHDLPPGYLHQTAETVSYGGLDFLVPCLELQFVEKFEGANEPAERRLRQKTDAAWLAATYGMDTELVHSTIDEFVIAPELAKFQPPSEVAAHNYSVLAIILSRAKRRISRDLPQADETELTEAAKHHFTLIQYGRRIGVTDLATLIDSDTGRLTDNAAQLLREAESQRQATVVSALQAKHDQVSAVLQAA